MLMLFVANRLTVGIRSLSESPDFRSEGTRVTQPIAIKNSPILPNMEPHKRTP